MKVKFVPQNVEFEIKPGQSVMHLAEDNGLYVKSVCRGVPSCAECRVKIVDGETNMFQPVAAELALIGSGWFIDRRRLSCQLQCIGDVTVDMSEQIAKQQGLIGGRKAKAAKAIGDRVEDETVIRDSSENNVRGRSRDESGPDEELSSDSRSPRQGSGGRRDQRVNEPRTIGIEPRAIEEPHATISPRPVIGQPAPSPTPAGTAPPKTSGIVPVSPGTPAGPGGHADGSPNGGQGRGGRSRRGGRRR